MRDLGPVRTVRRRLRRQPLPLGPYIGGHRGGLSLILIRLSGVIPNQTLERRMLPSIRDKWRHSAWILSCTRQKIGLLIKFGLIYGVFWVYQHSSRLCFVTLEEIPNYLGLSEVWEITQFSRLRIGNLLISVFFRNLRIVRPLDAEPPAFINGSLSGTKVHRICEKTKLLRDFSPFVLLSHVFMLSLHTEFIIKAILWQRRMRLSLKM